MGVAMLSANASAQLSATMGSINAHLPSLMSLLGLNAPALTALSQLASLSASVQAMLGISLGAPGAVAQLQAALSASATASASASARDERQCLGRAGLVGRAGHQPGCARSDGQPFGGAERDGQPFAPALTVPPASLASLIGILAALANIKSGLGVNLLAPNAAASLNAAIGALPISASSQPEPRGQRHRLGNRQRRRIGQRLRQRRARMPRSLR